MLNYYFDFTVYDVDGGRDLDIFDINEGILEKKQKKNPEENVLFLPNSKFSSLKLSLCFNLIRGRVEPCRRGHSSWWGNLIELLSPTTQINGLD